MGLVEVVSTADTDPAVFQSAMQFVKTIGKHPVACRDTPVSHCLLSLCSLSLSPPPIVYIPNAHLSQGFVVNRLLVPYLVQSLLLLERGDASKEDIDMAMKLGAGHPMGPIQLADYVGLDTCLHILQGWKHDYPNEPAFVVPQSLVEKVKQGKFGRKSGEGFYKWQGDKVIA
jgi:3-hydroxyacyl-CoA dehydrogenase